MPSILRAGERLILDKTWKARRGLGKAKKLFQFQEDFIVFLAGGLELVFRSALFIYELFYLLEQLSEQLFGFIAGTIFKELTPDLGLLLGPIQVAPVSTFHRIILSFLLPFFFLTWLFFFYGVISLKLLLMRSWANWRFFISYSFFI